MAYVYNCCFYFSLRLGSIIIATLSLIQGSLLIALFGVGFGDTKGVSNQMDMWAGENELLFLKPPFESFKMDPEKYIVAALATSSGYALSCIMCIYGAFKFNTYMIYPYLAFELIRIIILSAIHVTGMMIVKENIINLGLLIGLCVMGGFLLLGLAYMWVCVLSLVQVIKELIREIEITDITNFPTKPIPKTDIYTVRNRFTYNNY